MRLSTILIAVGLLLIVIPVPVLPPLVGTIIGTLLLLCGLLLRFLDM